MNAGAMTRALAAAVGAPVLHGDAVGPYLLDATEAHGLRGRAEAVVLARTADDVARTLAWCYEHDVPLTTRGGGSGYAGGAVPDGGVVVALAGLRSVRSLEPLQWRAELESGVTTHEVQRLARESGLYYPPDPGAAEQSQLGGNVATNAGGPHAFKYGVTGAWVTGLEVAIAPGELVAFGRGLRKDVAGDAAIEFLDGACFAISGRAFPLALRHADRPAFVVIAEADGGEAAAGLRAAAAAERVFDAALALGGSISGEHGVGLVKSPQLRKQLSPAAVEIHRAVKQLFDPKNLLNRGKKVA